MCKMSDLSVVTKFLGFLNSFWSPTMIWLQWNKQTLAVAIPLSCRKHPPSPPLVSILTGSPNSSPLPILYLGAESTIVQNKLSYARWHYRNNRWVGFFIIMHFPKTATSLAGRLQTTPFSSSVKIPLVICIIRLAFIDQKLPLRACADNLFVVVAFRWDRTFKRIDTQ